MTHLLQTLLHVPAPVVLSAIAALVFGEAAFFLGFVLPGETAVLLGGFLASTGRIHVVLLAVVVVVAAIVGDSVGYEVGRRLGPRMLRSRPLRRHQRRVAGARAFLDGRGASAVFLGRFTAFLRALVPGLAGLSQMRYRAGSSYEKVAHYLGQGGAAVVAVALVVGFVVWRRRRRRTPAPAETGVGRAESHRPAA